VSETGGHRPHLNVVVRLEDLENRARAACLDFGGTLSPEALRMLCCDAAVVPVVLNGKGQPLDVGRATRTIPDGLRRAVVVRDRGCAHPGCDRPPSWCEVHHIEEWERGGETKQSNLVMLCRVHHRQIHSTEWAVRIRDGLPEFIPPQWIDPLRRPRRKALPHLAGTPA
jgi:5-methylcytosine-specific restriction protein A